MKEPQYTLEALKHQACGGEGYQLFDVDFSTKTLRPLGKHKVKYNLIVEYMRRVMPGKSVIDIGCDKGLYSYMAYRSGASSVLGNEKNKKLTQYRQLLFKCLGVPATFTDENYFRDLSKPVPTADCVLALSVLHEIKQGSLEEKISRIRQMSVERSLLEFCEDYQHRFGQWWDLDLFQSLANKHYRTVVLISKYDAWSKDKGVRYLFDCQC